MTLNCMTLLCTYLDQMIIQQRVNILLQIQFYSIFTNVLSIIFINISQTYELPKIHNKIPNYCQTLNNNHLLGQFYVKNFIGSLNCTPINFTENVPFGANNSFGTKLKKTQVGYFLKRCSAKKVLFLLHEVLSLFFKPCICTGD